MDARSQGLVPREGGCRCGKVRFRVSAQPLLTMACHCRGCQRMTAAPFSLSAAIPAEGFEVLAGETVLGGLHGPHEHHFCGWCMSWVFTRPAGMSWFVNVRTPLLDDPSGYEPFVETATAEKMPWASTPAVHSFEDLPPIEAYQGLVEAYAARSSSTARAT